MQTWVDGVGCGGGRQGKDRNPRSRESRGGSVKQVCGLPRCVDGAVSGVWCQPVFEGGPLHVGVWEAGGPLHVVVGDVGRLLVHSVGLLWMVCG